MSTNIIKAKIFTPETLLLSFYCIIRSKWGFHLVSIEKKGKSKSRLSCTVIVYFTDLVG
jgi:hypothetical protein